MSGLTTDEIAALFKKHADEHGAFNLIPVAERRHARPDICAMLLMAERLPIDGHPDIVTAASHDVIYFQGPGSYGTPWPFTEDDVIYLRRCGIGWEYDTGGMYSFV